MRDPAALLYRSTVAVEDRWPLADRAEGLHDRDARMISFHSLSPLLRGEGRGEGLYPRALHDVRPVPPHPDCSAIRPLPASGARLKRPARRDMGGSRR